MKMKINHLTLFLTADCNMQCSYCFLGNKSRDIMSWETARKAVNLLDHNDGKKSVSFFGGEPLLQSELLFEIADYIRRGIGSEVNLSVTTNGVLLTPDMMEKLQKYNIFVVLSLDGYGEEANIHRKFPDGRKFWDVLEHNLSHIPTENIGAVRMTVVPSSVSELYYNFSMLLLRGFDHINFALDYASEWTNDDLEIYKSEFSKILQLYYEQIAQKKKTCIDFVDNIILNVTGGLKIGCRYGFGSVAVSAQGYVFPCHREVLDTVSGQGIPIDEFALNRSWKESICTENHDELCAQCDLFGRCTVCMAELKKMGGSMDCIPDLVCNVNKIHIFETDKMMNRLFHFYKSAFQCRYQ